MRYHRTFAASVAAAALITPLLAVSLPANAARQAPGTVARAGHKHGPNHTERYPAQQHLAEDYLALAVR